MCLRSILFSLLLAPSVIAAPPARPNILLVVLDTLRYDATQNGNMPFLASLAPRGGVHEGVLDARRHAAIAFLDHDRPSRISSSPATSTAAPSSKQCST
jgi:hypothetical protein